MHIRCANSQGTLEVYNYTYKVSRSLLKKSLKSLFTQPSPGPQIIFIYFPDGVRYFYIFNIELIENCFKICPNSALTNLTHLFQGQAKSDQSEVWFHEDCICWMPQIRLIGCQILGLSEAIRVSQRAVCGKCNYRGSTLACSQMRCRETAHFPCAQDMDWTIDEDNFLARCHLHSEETTQ